MGGAQRLAGDLLAHVVGAASLLDMGGKLRLEGRQCLEDVGACLVADDAVACVANHGRQGLGCLELQLACGAVCNGMQHRRELGQAIAAGNALAAGLGRAVIAMRCGQDDGAGPRRDRLDPALEGISQRADLGVSSTRRLNGKNAHGHLLWLLSLHSKTLQSCVNLTELKLGMRGERGPIRQAAAQEVSATLNVAGSEGF